MAICGSERGILVIFADSLDSLDSLDFRLPADDSIGVDGSVGTTTPFKVD
jgi:hypothetical protein